LVIERWDASRIRLFLTEVVESEEAPTWRELATKIGRIGRWEFEDYGPRLLAGFAVVTRA
jgi:hypothetical protein